MDKLTCKLCGREFKNLISHISQKHSMTGAEYKLKFGNQPLLLVSDETRRKSSKSQKRRFDNPDERRKNSDSQKNGGSIFSTNYWMNKHGMSLDEAKLNVSRIQTKNALKSAESYSSDRSCFTPEYWMKHKNMEESDAIIKVSQLQQKLSARSSKFKGKVRTDESKLKVSEVQKAITLENLGI